MYTYTYIVVVQLLSHVQLFVTPRNVASLFLGFPRQKYWNGLPFPSPGYLPNPGTEPASLALARDFTAEPPWKPIYTHIYMYTHIYICIYTYSLYKWGHSFCIFWQHQYILDIFPC